MRFPPLEGDILYHGTATEELFEEDGDPPDGPAWFSDGQAVADRFKTWHPGPHPRVIRYLVVSEPRLFIIQYDRDMKRLLGEERFEDGDYDIEDMVAEVELLGYDGWFIPENYPEGADIMLLYPEQYLEAV